MENNTSNTKTQWFPTNKIHTLKTKLINKKQKQKQQQ
jgi:hypothetical protein